MTNLISTRHRQELASVATTFIDRAQRDAVASLLRRFLSAELTAFEFDDLLNPYRSSVDPAVRFIVQQAWYFYDDCVDHRVDLEKPAWDYLQRLLLLLESDCEVQRSVSRHWSWTQAIALLSLLGFAWIAWQWGWGSQLLIAAMPFGLISIAIGKVRQFSAAKRETKPASPFHEIVFPFESFADLRGAYEAVSFQKTPRPESAPARQPTRRSRLLQSVLWLQAMVHWLIFSPVVLAVQTLPLGQVTLRVVRPDSAASEPVPG